MSMNTVVQTSVDYGDAQLIQCANRRTSESDVKKSYFLHFAKMLFFSHFFSAPGE